LRFPSKITRRLVSFGFMPTTRLGWFTLYLGGIELVLILLELAMLRLHAPGAAANLDPWVRFLGLIFLLLFTFLTLRWFRDYVMWWLRNRLIVTYLFIGGVPVFLVLAMAIISAYFLLLQFASFLAVSEIQTQLQNLHNTNAAIAEQIENQPGTAERYVSGKLNPNDSNFPGLTVQVVPDSERPPWLQGRFSSLVTDHGKLSLRAARLATTRGHRSLVVSVVPLDSRFLAKIAANLGPISIVQELPGDNVAVNVDPSKGVTVNGRHPPMISAGNLPAARHPMDQDFPYYSLVQAIDWQTGKSETGALLIGRVRLSTLYSYLSVSASRQAELLSLALTALAITFGLIVLIALLIGIRLTRTITYSVANLYEATQFVNRGDFSHRIPVKQRDQLGELQMAFNSMTESVEKLIAEQKEKERLQSELEIAQEVQAQLFPTALSSTRTLELHGICRPARIVSGDYYDFLSYGSEQIGIAVGDISGKGISAALLMATIHSAVRAYEHEQLVAVNTRVTQGPELPSGSVALAISPNPPQSPSQVLWLLNRHLHRTTPMEKYATLFLGFYDGHARRMVYSNAGHLPPLILGADGSVRRLEAGGTVVGLFESVEYEEATVELSPGDIFVAFSDGITEPENEFGEFGEQRLIETIELYRHLPLERIADHVISAVQDWIGTTEQPDDITLVLARPRG
jgi:sigma-B regulation protein RsbU (phosphoserine phosphatase)